jgi:hypothetical protein
MGSVALMGDGLSRTSDVDFSQTDHISISRTQAFVNIGIITSSMTTNTAVILGAARQRA